MLEDRIAIIAQEASTVPGVKAELIPLPLINRVPTLNISWDRSKIQIENLAANLRDGYPSIEVMGGAEGSINVTAHMLKNDEVKIVAKRIKQELYKAMV